MPITGQPRFFNRRIRALRAKNVALKTRAIMAVLQSLREAGKRGRLKRSKARNLLERLRNFEHDVLRFMDVEYVPFTNNQGENDLRMTKVQQKISGCFRSIAGAKIFCRVRSYLSTCRKQGMSATKALALLFQGKNPAFMDTDETQF